MFFGFVDLPVRQTLEYRNRNLSFFFPASSLFFFTLLSSRAPDFVSQSLCPSRFAELAAVIVASRLEDAALHFSRLCSYLVVGQLPRLFGILHLLLVGVSKSLGFGRGRDVGSSGGFSRAPQLIVTSPHRDWPTRFFFFFFFFFFFVVVFSRELLDLCERSATLALSCKTKS
jgi:hypothetical protein